MHISTEKQQCRQLFTLTCKLPTPQVEKVCGPLGAGPMMTSANHVSNHTNLHITTSVTATSVTSERSSVTSSPSVVPADHQHLQLQSQRWITNDGKLGLDREIKSIPLMFSGVFINLCVCPFVFHQVVPSQGLQRWQESKPEKTF